MIEGTWRGIGIKETWRGLRRNMERYRGDMERGKGA